MHPTISTQTFILISQDCNGYSVILSETYLRTHTLRSNNEDCGTKDGKWTVKKKKKDAEFYNEDYLEYDDAPSSCDYCASPQAFPLEYCALIKKFTDKYSFDQLTLINITIDEKFLEHIAPLLGGLNVLKYGCTLFHTPIAKNLPMEKLSHFMASLNASRIVIGCPNFPIASMDEQFIINFPSSKLNINVVEEYCEKTLEIHRFKPTAKFVPVLARFDELTFPGLILNPRKILKALKLRMASDLEVRWNISTTSAIFDLSILDLDKFTITENESDASRQRLSIEMKKRNSDKTLSITVDDRGEGCHPLWAEVSYCAPYIWGSESVQESDSNEESGGRSVESDSKSSSEDESMETGSETYSDSDDDGVERRRILASDFDEEEDSED